VNEEQKVVASNMRIGHGFDVHRFAEQFDPQKPLTLANCSLNEELSLEAHSDGDVVLHALCDALLGAVALGDIGEHFPDDDQQFAGADSADLLRHVLTLVHDKGFQLVNVDLTVIAQRPRLSTHKQAMRLRIAELCALTIDRVNIKATTTEGLGAIGRAEGIACHVVALLVGQA